jgi:hypothetical protein
MQNCYMPENMDVNKTYNFYLKHLKKKSKAIPITVSGGLFVVRR